MKQYKSKRILPSHRQGLYYLEHCRVMCHDDRIVYARQKDAFTQFVAIPQKNTSVILLGSGTSITQRAAQKLCDENVMVSFTSGQGTPLYLASQNEYRPTEYMQSWVSFWFDEQKRLQISKKFQEERTRNVSNYWSKYGIYYENDDQEIFLKYVHNAKNIEEILLAEGRYTKKLYKTIAEQFKVDSFTRKRELPEHDIFNDYLDHGNYLAYGLSATALWTLGLSFSFPVFHGKTRRGALVFDVADLIKDAIVLPTAFQMAIKSSKDQEFRDECMQRFRSGKVLRYLIVFLKNICEKYSCTLS